MSPFEDTFQRHSIFEQNLNNDFDHTNSVYTGHEHDDLFKKISESIKLDGGTLFSKASDQVNSVFQGASDLINAPFRIINSIQEFW